ncbi:hypothetical protein SP41_31 [Salmonella phage 41]|nr:hypothetical protein SP41_31 [Salmonella phage 41]
MKKSDENLTEPEVCHDEQAPDQRGYGVKLDLTLLQTMTLTKRSTKR